MVWFEDILIPQHNWELVLGDFIQQLGSDSLGRHELFFEQDERKVGSIQLAPIYCLLVYYLGQRVSEIPLHQRQNLPHSFLAYLHIQQSVLLYTVDFGK